MKCVVSALLIFAGLELTFSYPECTWQDFGEKFQKYSVELRWPGSAVELQEACSIFLVATDHIIEYAKKCSTETEVGSYLDEDALRNEKEKITELCTGGSDLNIKYIENAKCLKDYVNHYMECAELTVGSGEKQTSICSIVYMSYGCVFKAIQDKCGKDAFDVMKSLTETSLKKIEGICCSQKKPFTNFTSPSLFFF